MNSTTPLRIYTIQPGRVCQFLMTDLGPLAGLIQHPGKWNPSIAAPLALPGEPA
jgi:hypothetical protein